MAATGKMIDMDGGVQLEWLQEGQDHEIKFMPDGTTEAQSGGVGPQPEEAMPSRERIAEIRRRFNAATPGPWCAEECGDKCTAIVVGTAFADTDEDCEHPLEGWPVFEDADGNTVVTRSDIVCHPDGARSREDADFIAHVWDDIRALLAALEARPAVTTEAERAVQTPEQSPILREFFAPAEPTE